MKAFANKINDKSLETVAGGTHRETQELLSIFVSNGFLADIIRNRQTAALDVKNCLSAIGISAKISVDVIGEKNNVYIDQKTCDFLTHREVVKRATQSRP